MISEIRNGIPWTKNDDVLLTDLPVEEQELILGWISNNIWSRKTPNMRHSSYGIKQPATRLTGVYVTNNQFKHAMMLSGYMPVDEWELNWHFCISEKSPIFVANKRGELQFI